MLNSYLLVDKYTDQSSGEKMCIIFNFMNDFPNPLKEVDLRSLISNGEVNLINANNQSLEFRGSAGGSVLASKLDVSEFLRNNLTKTTLAGANKNTRKFLKKFKDLNKFDMAILMYKLNKISYFTSSKIKRLPFVYYNYYEFMPILNPMQFLITKNTDVEKKVQFGNFQITCDELAEDLPIDIGWCTMFSLASHKLKNKDNLYRKLPSVLWGIFEDVFDEKIDVQNTVVKQKIKTFLVHNCAWYISDNLKSFSLKEKRVW